MRTTSAGKPDETTMSGAEQHITETRPGSNRPRLDQPRLVITAVRTRTIAERSKNSLRRAGVLWAARLAVVVIALAVWQLVSSLHVINPIFFSSPSGVWSYLWSTVIIGGQIWGDAATTLKAVIIAFFIGGVLGIAAGSLFIGFPFIERMFDPFVTLFNSFPRVALAPIFIAWLGIGLWSKTLTAVSLMFFVVLINTVAGAKNLDPDALVLFRSLGASKTSTFRKLVWPTAVPSIFAGLKLGLVYAILGVVFTEMLASGSGIGYQIAYQANTFHMAAVFGLLVVLGVVTTALALLMDFLQHRLLKWQE